MLLSNVNLAPYLMPGYIVPKFTLLQAMYSVVFLLKKYANFLAKNTLGKNISVNPPLNHLLYSTVASNEEQICSYLGSSQRKNVKRLKCEKEFSELSGALILIPKKIF